MSLNSAEIDLVLSELDIEGCRIQKILQPDFSTLLLLLYRYDTRKNLLVSLSPGRTRLHLTEKGFPRAEKQQRFVQFLKARITGGTIKSVTHPGHERIVKIEITNQGETTLLWVRLWGGNANIIATDNEMAILDLFYRRPGKKEVSGEILYLPESVTDLAGNQEIAAPSVAKTKTDKYAPRNFPAEETSFCRYIDDFYSTGEEKEKTEKLREKLTLRLNKALSLLKSSRAKIDSELKSQGSHEKLMQYGNLILASAYRIKKGDKWLDTENFYDSNQPVSIELDPYLSPEENANRYFEKYRKTKSGGTSLAEEKENTEARIERTENLLESVEKASGLDELEKIAETTGAKKEKKRESLAPGLIFYSGIYTILAGRTASENDELLRRHARGNDYWLHARDYPGGYVFIKEVRGKPVPLETLIDAGTLALYFSKGRKNGKGEVYCTRVKYLRRAKHGKKGTVIPTQEKNLSIEIRESVINRLFEREKTQFFIS